jgi:hypothetical protein
VPPSLPEALVSLILDDLRAGRLCIEEIAAIRLGSKKKGGTISKIAKKYKITVNKRGHRRTVSFQPKLSTPENEPSSEIEVESFDSETRLSLIDTAITIHKSLLPGCTDPYKMDKWSAALERLLEQRRTEEPNGNNKEDELLTKFTDALETHALSTQTGGCLPGLPEDPPNSDVRIGEERKDGDPAILHSEGN